MYLSARVKLYQKQISGPEWMTWVFLFFPQLIYSLAFKHSHLLLYLTKLHMPFPKQKSTRNISLQNDCQLFCYVTKSNRASGCHKFCRTSVAQTNCDKQCLFYTSMIIFFYTCISFSSPYFYGNFFFHINKYLSSILLNSLMEKKSWGLASPCISEKWFLRVERVEWILSVYWMIDRSQQGIQLHSTWFNAINS